VFHNVNRLSVFVGSLYLDKKRAVFVWRFFGAKIKKNTIIKTFLKKCFYLSFKLYFLSEILGVILERLGKFGLLLI
jgi:hypothetical protein